jgi:Sulfite exporter TauE/SafE
MSDLMLLASILIAAGGLSGFLAGVFGVGGGTVVVPVLYAVFVMLGVGDDLRMPLCAGTSLALIIPTSIASFTSHRKTDAVNFGLLTRASQRRLEAGYAQKCLALVRGHACHRNCLRGGNVGSMVKS